MRATLASVVVLAALLAGCGDDAAPAEPGAVDLTAPQFADAPAVAKALRQAGFGCRDFTRLKDSRFDEGQCLLNGNVTTFIAHFADADQHQQYLEFAQEDGCQSLVAESQPRRFLYVNGNLWTIEPSSDRQLVDRIAAEIGGTAAVIDCTTTGRPDDPE